jgi:hypothetical protein
MNVYVCVTLYHAFFSLLKIYHEGANRNSNIVFLNANNEKVYQQYCYISNQLKKMDFTCDVRLRSLKGELIGIENKKNKNQLNIATSKMKQENKTDFVLFNFAWNNSYIYPSARLLYKNAKSVILIEESTLIAKLGQEKAWKKNVHRMMGDVVDFYKDSKLDSIMVTRPVDYPSEWRSKLQKVNIKDYISVLSVTDKEEIFSIMSSEGKTVINALKEPGYGIVYTCPFSEQNVISEKEKIKQVLMICDYYKQYAKVILKLHPRDLTHYPVNKEVVIIPAMFPSELLSMIDYTFEFAASVCSSAVNTTNAKYKININDSFYKNPVFKLLDINGNEVKL